MSDAPKPVRRLKTYTAETGFVYQFYFVGKRRALAGLAPAVEFIFDVSPDRKLKYSVSVFLSDAAVAAWTSAHGRRPSDAEQYAAAKTRLLRAFDEIGDMFGSGRQLALEFVLLEELFDQLGVE